MTEQNLILIFNPVVQLVVMLFYLCSPLNSVLFFLVDHVGKKLVEQTLTDVFIVKKIPLPQQPHKTTTNNTLFYST